MKRYSVLVLILLILSACYALAYPVRVEAAYKGKVIDADTGKPLEGVVVVIEWDTVTPSPGGAVHTFYDARETVTDKKGNFSIPGKFFGFLLGEYITIFKAGYAMNGEAYQHGYKFYIVNTFGWNTLKTLSGVKLKGGKPIIPLEKITMEERKKLRFDAPICPLTGKECKEKLPFLIKEINKDRKEVTGLGPIY